jgi:Domain of unknown function (DUF4978)/Beta-galactosidase
VLKLTRAISSVDTSSDKVTLLVDGAPFFYNGIQISPHRLMDRDGWTWSDLECLFQAAAETEFTVLGVPIRWNRLEPAPGRFDWTDVDHALDLGARHNLKLEFIWFGSQICSLSDPSNGTPEFLFDNFEFVVDENGVAIEVQDKDHITGNQMVYRKLDIASRALLGREAGVLSLTLAHVHRYLNEHGLPNVLVGIDVLNEPTSAVLWNQHKGTARSHSASANESWSHENYPDSHAFNAHLMWLYLNGLACAVKLSDYPVWTRTNFHEALEGPEQMAILLQLLESERAAGRAFLDFIGADLYVDDLDAVHRYGTDSIYRIGRNLVMVMENNANYHNSDQLIFNALASDSSYHMWEICDTIPELPGGLYWVDAAVKRLRPKPHSERVRRLNRWLRRNAFDLATLRPDGGRLCYFNRHFAPTYHATRQIGAHSIDYMAEATGAGIASASEDDLVLMSTSDATFRIVTSRRIASAQRGRFDERRTWFSDGDIPVATHRQEITVKCGEFDCLRITFG